MLNIAICDDEPCGIAAIKNKLTDYMGKNNMEAVVHTYEKGEDLLNSDVAGYDIIFLDVDMNSDLNGIEIARQIRLCNKGVLLIYVSGYIQYAPEGYSVKAFAYILKKDLDKLFSRVMDEAMEEINFIGYRYNFTENGITVSLPLINIEYAESFNKIIEIHTVNHTKDKYTIKMKLGDFYRAVKNKGFIQIHKSYVINVRHTKALKGYTATLISGKELPVGQKRQKEVSAQYLAIKSKQQ